MRHPLLALAAAAAVTLLPACGGSEDGRAALAGTADRLAEIRSGRMALKLTIEPRDDPDAGRVGFELAGPFSLPRDGALPTARLEYTQIAGPRTGGATFVSTGEAAFVEVDGTAYALPPAQAVGGGVDDGLGTLRVDRWLKEPSAEEAGPGTERIVADLDVAAALTDLFDTARRAGAGDALPEITAEEAERIGGSVREARVEVVTGNDDRLMRKLDAHVEFGLDVPESLRDSLGDVVGATVRFTLELDDHNEPVTVEAPGGARPFAELPASG